MRVKCKACGNMIEKQSAYMIINGKTKMYYCSKEEIEKLQSMKKAKDDLYDVVCDIFGYKIQNSALFKEWKCWNALADNDKILNYLYENKNRINIAMQKVKDSAEYNKIRYFSAILKNSLADFKVEKGVEPQKIEVNNEIYEPVSSTKKKHRGLSDLEDEV